MDQFGEKRGDGYYYRFFIIAEANGKVTAMEVGGTLTAFAPKADLRKFTDTPETGSNGIFGETTAFFPAGATISNVQEAWVDYVGCEQTEREYLDPTGNPDEFSLTDLSSCVYVARTVGFQLGGIDNFGNEFSEPRTYTMHDVDLEFGCLDPSRCSEGDSVDSPNTGKKITLEAHVKECTGSMSHEEQKADRCWEKGSPLPIKAIRIRHRSSQECEARGEPETPLIESGTFKRTSATRTFGDHGLWYEGPWEDWQTIGNHYCERFVADAVTLGPIPWTEEFGFIKYGELLEPSTEEYTPYVWVSPVRSEASANGNAGYECYVDSRGSPGVEYSHGVTHMELVYEIALGGIKLAETADFQYECTFDGKAHPGVRWSTDFGPFSAAGSYDIPLGNGTATISHGSFTIGQDPDHLATTKLYLTWEGPMQAEVSMKCVYWATEFGSLEPVRREFGQTCNSSGSTRGKKHSS